MNNRNTTLVACFLALISLGCKTQEPQPSPYDSDPMPEHQTFHIKSEKVGEKRVISVWTPPGYTDSNDSYPVLYMPDGGLRQEDFPHIANTIAELVESGAIPPTIVVGIENTQRRRDLTGSSQVAEDAKLAPVTDGAAKFRAFIKDELFPEIERRYRTNGKRAFVGESLAGLFVVETLMLDPNMFDVYIAVDPSLWWNNAYLVENASEFLSKMPEGQRKLWFAGSQAADISKHTERLAKTLESEAPEFLMWTCSNEQTEQHSTIFRATKVKAFRWALGKPEEQKKDD